mmetsp:Transcript_22307/g.54530  ORF Transcript_22307/g.54530 Transcript_22307/m.54530 type:complete len:287 (-) Transcript_22307:395-1255(-)
MTVSIGPPGPVAAVLICLFLASCQALEYTATFTGSNACGGTNQLQWGNFTEQVLSVSTANYAQIRLGGSSYPSINRTNAISCSDTSIVNGIALALSNGGNYDGYCAPQQTYWKVFNCDNCGTGVGIIASWDSLSGVMDCTCPPGSHRALILRPNAPGQSWKGGYGAECDQGRSDEAFTLELLPAPKFSADFVQGTDVTECGPISYQSQMWQNFRSGLVPSALDEMTIFSSIAPMNYTCKNVTVVRQVASALLNGNNTITICDGVGLVHPSFVIYPTIQLSILMGIN